MTVSPRGFLAAVFAAVALAGAPALCQAAGAEFVTLGTGGGPVVRLERSEPANAVVVGDEFYLFDVGDGVQRQLVAAKLKLAKLRAIFISHHHIDHNAGLAPVVVDRWLFRNSAPLPVIGPPGTVALVKGIAEGYHATELAPLEIGGPPMPTIAATLAARDLAPDMDTPQLVYEDKNLRVLAITNAHYHFPAGSEEQRLARSYAYRIELPGRVIVFTGDSGPTPRLALLAKGADLLVSEVIDVPHMERLLRQGYNRPQSATQLAGLIAHMREDHLTPDEIGKLAAAAGVKEVVLTHLVPGIDGETDLSGYTAGIDAHFKGKVSVAHDLERF
jgi:ribonuclease BN (tRNA processing enzyme)